MRYGVMFMLKYALKVLNCVSVDIPQSYIYLNFTDITEIFGLTKETKYVKITI